jgi:23S rRNA (cytidine2498-2'-O)-methyltransferase
MSSSFLLVTCHVGAEPVLRRAIPEALPGARSAFARPGLVTFKRDSVPADLPRPHPLARTWGCSLGPVHSVEALRAKIADLPAPVRVQVVVGEAGKPGKVPESVLGAWRHRAGAVATEVGASTDPAVDGETVVEVVVRLDEPWVVAWHRHGPDRGPLPGGRWDLTPPPDAPSRAWSKLEELLAWSRVAPVAGDLVLEVGCAPGGATVALLDRGVRVVGVDPQEVTLPDRLAAAPFTHVRAAMEGLPREALPDGVRWIVLDANMAAPAALHALHRLVPRYRSTLRGVVATLKLNEWALVDQLPRWLAQLEEQGLRPVGAANLPSFRQELGLVAVQ